MIEHDPALRLLTAVFLTREGFDVDTAPDAHTAVWLTQRQPPAVIALDAALPDAPGFDLLEVLSAEAAARHRATQILLLTNRHFQVADRAEALAAGATDFLPKPFTADELGAKARAMLSAA